ncbi:MAG: hypothetical protein IJL87_04020 [Clostridia bacterium]|nr:hypothetical protein [Clostridia bacterium]
MNNSGYSAADIYAMQKEAEQRVFEMQRRARQTLDERETEENPPNPAERKSDSPLEGLLEMIGTDREKALIVALIALLMKEHSGEPIIAALIYLLGN